jgi:hypothetical protein
MLLSNAQIKEEWRKRNQSFNKNNMVLAPLLPGETKHVPGNRAASREGRIC